MSQKGESFSSVTKTTADGSANNLRPSFNPARRNQEKRPTKDQAVVLTTANPTNIHITPYYAYIRAVANVVGAQHILAASKIPGSKFCIFMSSQEIAKKFIEENSTLQVNNIDFLVSPYVQPAAKLVLCNTFPFIPNYIFEEALDKILDRTVLFISPMKDMSMGFLDKEYSNISFFKRYIFIQSTESKDIVIPDYIIVTYEGNSYRVYLEIENKCKKCQGPHPTNKCPSNQDPQEVKQNLEIRLNKAKQSTNKQVDNIHTNTPPSKEINIPVNTELSGIQPIQQVNITQDANLLMEIENIPFVQTEPLRDIGENKNEDTFEGTIFTPTTPINENNKRLLVPSPSAAQQKTKKSQISEEEEILEISSAILIDRADIMIDPHEITRLWMELKGKQNKKDILHNNTFSISDLYQIFEALYQHPNMPKNYKIRAKKIAAILYADQMSDHSDSASVRSLTD